MTTLDRALELCRLPSNAVHHLVCEGGEHLVLRHVAGTPCAICERENPHPKGGVAGGEGKGGGYGGPVTGKKALRGDEAG